METRGVLSTSQFLTFGEEGKKTPPWDYNSDFGAKITCLGLGPAFGAPRLHLWPGKAYGGQLPTGYAGWCSVVRGESLLALESHPQSQYENIWTSRTRDLEEWEREGGGQRAQKRRKPHPGAVGGREVPCHLVIHSSGGVEFGHVWVAEKKEVEGKWGLKCGNAVE